MFDSPAAAYMAADAVLAVHAAFIAFVVLGQIYVLFGWALDRGWARNPWFRRLHLAAIGIVVLLAWIGIPCPLTSFESEFRAEAGAGTYRRGFLAHWLSRLIYYDLPTWVFVLAYSLFGALVVLSYWRFPPAKHVGNRNTATTRL